MVLYGPSKHRERSRESGETVALLNNLIGQCVFATKDMLAGMIKQSAFRSATVLLLLRIGLVQSAPAATKIYPPTIWCAQ
jgi:hypothetical protein